MIRSRILALLVASSVLWGGVKLSNSLTDGFFVANIVYDLPFDLRRPVTQPSEEKLESVRSILLQDYFYLCKGRQSYVFLSEDGQYVLKFFKYQRMRPLWWAKTFGWIPAVQHKWERRSASNEAKLERLFNGCKVAYENLSDITGVVYVKLDDSYAPVPSVSIYDKLGIKHEIPLDDRQFILQVKAEPFDQKVKTLIENGDMERAEAMILSTIELLMEENDRGFIDLDPAIVKNTAIFNGTPIHIDIGQFAQIDEYDSDFVKQDFLDKIDSFLLWVSELNGEMAVRIDEAVDRLLIDKGF